jgi:hypothetical protein
MIFIFRKYNLQTRIIIYAKTYLEAKETLFELNPWADKVYNILEYKMYDINKTIYHETLEIDSDMDGYPRIISESEFKELEKNNAILDEQFKNIHNTKVLTKKFAGENTNLLSTEEFVGQLKNHAESVDKTKKSIKQMLNVVGDIWFEEFYVKGLGLENKYIVYGKSRYQCKETLKKLKNKYFDNRFTTYNIQRLLIEYDNDELKPISIERYDNMVNFMKENNIKKFPFITYKGEES